MLQHIETILLWELLWVIKNSSDFPFWFLASTSKYLDVNIAKTSLDLEESPLFCVISSHIRFYARRAFPLSVHSSLTQILFGLSSAHALTFLVSFVQKKKKEKKSNHISTWFTGETDMRAAIDIINGRKKEKFGLWKCSYVKWTKHNYYLIRGVGVGGVRGKTTTTQLRRQVTFWIAHSIAQVVLSLNCALNCTGSSLSELRTQLRR